MIPEKMARRYNMLAVAKINGVVSLAMADPLDIRAVDAARLETKTRIKKVVAGQSAIRSAIDRSYHTANRLKISMDDLIAGEVTSAAEAWFSEENSLSNVDQLKLEASDVPVVQFVNLILMRAVQERASDIHLEPEENIPILHHGVRIEQERAGGDHHKEAGRSPRQKPRQDLRCRHVPQRQAQQTKVQHRRYPNPHA